MTTTIDELLRSSGLPRTEAALPGDLRKFYLHAGQLYATAEATEIVTILGSCVAVCLWDEIAGVGGMNHFLLPEPLGASSPRFAGPAFEELRRQLVLNGARPARR